MTPEHLSKIQEAVRRLQETWRVHKPTDSPGLGGDKGKGSTFLHPACQRSTRLLDKPPGSYQYKLQPMPHGANLRVCGIALQGHDGFSFQTWSLATSSTWDHASFSQRKSLACTPTSRTTEAWQRVKKCWKVLRTCQVPPTDDVVSLAKLVLELNSFTCKTQHCLQIWGTAMGTPWHQVMPTCS